MNRWEYMTWWLDPGLVIVQVIGKFPEVKEYAGIEFPLAMDNAGNSGWELVGTLSTEVGSGAIIFKRPKVEP